MSMNEYLWKSSDAAAEIRLLVEGAIALYEGDAMGLQSMAHKNQQPEGLRPLIPSGWHCMVCGKKRGCCRRCRQRRRRISQSLRIVNEDKSPTSAGRALSCL